MSVITVNAIYFKRLKNVLHIYSIICKIILKPNTNDSLGLILPAKRNAL